MEFSADDLPMLLEQVAAFTNKQLMPAALPYETPLSDQQRQALTIEAQQLGLLPDHQGASGLSLWENTQSAHAMCFNLSMLSHFARADAGLAFGWHRQSLALALAAACSATCQPAVTLLTTGHFGLARNALGHYLTDQPLSADSRNLLTDWLDPQRPRTLIAPADWQQLVMPLWAGNQIVWQLIDRDQLAVTPHLPQHGLDALCAFSVAASPFIKGQPLGQGALLTAQLIKQDMLGLLTIGLGSLQHLSLLTREYTALRRQGGVCIDQHPAVMTMLADIDSALTQTRLALQACERPLDSLPLDQLLLMRAHLHPLLCHAASQAMQAHGGTGYMQDVGIEKGLRAQNTLRMMAGGLTDIPLIVSGLKGAA